MADTLEVRPKSANTITKAHARLPTSPNLQLDFSAGVDDGTFPTLQIILVILGALKKCPHAEALVVRKAYPNTVFPAGLVKLSFMVEL